jgi:hypothetical protein
VIRLSEERARLAKRDKITLTLFPARRERVRNPETSLSEMRHVHPKSIYASAIVPLRDVAGGDYGRVRVVCRYLKPIREIHHIDRDWLVKGGFGDEAGFAAWWLANHAPTGWADLWSLSRVVERARTGVIRRDEIGPAVWDKFAGTTVCVVRFTTAVDIPRLLAPAGSPPKRSEVDHGVDSPGDHGYVMSPFLALPDEPEAIHPDEADELAAQAGQSQVARFAASWEDRRAQPLADRLRLAELDAASLKADVSGRLRVIERQVEAIERITMRRAA